MKTVSTYVRSEFYKTQFMPAELARRLECSQFALKAQLEHHRKIGGAGDLGRSIVKAERAEIAALKMALRGD
jgi:hypothetical protein